MNILGDAGFLSLTVAPKNSRLGTAFISRWNSPSTHYLLTSSDIQAPEIFTLFAEFQANYGSTRFGGVISPQFFFIRWNFTTE